LASCLIINVLQSASDDWKFDWEVGRNSEFIAMQKTNASSPLISNITWEADLLIASD